jgi:hypothetical protein
VNRSMPVNSAIASATKIAVVNPLDVYSPSIATSHFAASDKPRFLVAIQMKLITKLKIYMSPCSPVFEHSRIKKALFKIRNLYVYRLHPRVNK